MRNLSGGGPANPCWPYQPAEARTVAWPSVPPAFSGPGAGGGFAPCEALLWRVEPSCSAIPPDWRRGGRIRRTYSSAPPEAGRGATATINQTFCKAPCMANMRITMIELFSAWNSHE